MPCTGCEDGRVLATEYWALVAISEWKDSITVAFGPLGSVAGLAPALCGLKSRGPGCWTTRTERVGQGDKRSHASQASGGTLVGERCDHSSESSNRAAWPDEYPWRDLHPRSRLERPEN